MGEEPRMGVLHPLKGSHWRSWPFGPPAVLVLLVTDRFGGMEESGMSSTLTPSSVKFLLKLKAWVE